MRFSLFSWRAGGSMSAFDERRDQDVQKLKELQKSSRERIRVTRVAGTPASDIHVELGLKTAPSASYPRLVQDVTKLSISLPARYPFVEPIVTIQTPIFHPNVYTSGRICLGMTWIPSFGLDLLVRRIVQIITFDPTILNEASPANGLALSWYKQARRTHPDAFPSDTFSLSVPEKPKVKWDNISENPSKTVTSCPHCKARLSLPSGKKGRVNCPKCGSAFDAQT